MRKGIEKVYFVSANPADRHLFQIVIKELALEIETVFFKSAEDFLAHYERGEVLIGQNDVLFLDYFLIGKSGLDLLKSIRHNLNLSELTIFMMLPTLFEKIMESSYQEGANCCVLLAVDFNELINTLKGVLGYWNHMLA